MTNVEELLQVFFFTDEPELRIKTNKFESKLSTYYTRAHPSKDTKSKTSDLLIEFAHGHLDGGEIRSERRFFGPSVLDKTHNVGSTPTLLGYL